MNRPVRRIRLELTPEEHRAVRMAAAARDMSMTAFAEDAVMAAAAEVELPQRASSGRPTLPFGERAKLQPEALS